MHDAEAILLNGLYGVGKTTVLIEMADVLEAAGVRYAALDLDWLAWGWPGEGEAEADHGDHPTASPLLLEHLGLIVGSYRRRGNDRFVLAGSVASPEELALLRATLGMPMRVVRLTAPLDVVRARLGAEGTSGRDADAERSVAWAAGDAGPEHVPADLIVDTTHPVSAVATDILDRLGWLPAPRQHD